MVSSTQGAQTLTYAYDAASNRTGLTWPDAGSNALTVTGPNPIENVVIGLAFFADVANSVAQVCSARAGIPTGF